jgi:hypothetical protein
MFGTAIAGTILVPDLASGNQSYVLAMVTLAALALLGLWAALLLSGRHEPAERHGRALARDRNHAPTNNQPL